MAGNDGKTGLNGGQLVMRLGQVVFFSGVDCNGRKQTSAQGNSDQINRFKLHVAAKWGSGKSTPKESAVASNKEGW